MRISDKIWMGTGTLGSCMSRMSPHCHCGSCWMSFGATFVNRKMGKSRGTWPDGKRRAIQLRIDPGS